MLATGCPGVPGQTSPACTYAPCKRRSCCTAAARASGIPYIFIVHHAYLGLHVAAAPHMNRCVCDRGPFDSCPLVDRLVRTQAAGSVCTNLFGAPHDNNWGVRFTHGRHQIQASYYGGARGAVWHVQCGKQPVSVRAAGLSEAEAGQHPKRLGASCSW